MLFNSLGFLIFFPIVVLVYFLIPKKYQYIWLLLASYFFYMCWNVKYALLLLLSTVVTYISGLMIERYNDGTQSGQKRKKICVAMSFIINLLVLFFYKYLGFALDTITGIANLFGAQMDYVESNIILPVGISFYTFQALSYTMDVYRGTIKTEKNFLKYALFVSFFPQLVAGPIERSKNLLGQVSAYHSFNYDRARDGLYLMLWGYFLKLVVADRVAILVNNVFDNYQSASGFAIMLATILFAFQIYCDFAGYSTIAIGSAKVLGFNLMENFNAPYLADSVSDFWRRWHISLSSWFKDYLYIPLGGNRKGAWRKRLNVMIVFLVSGLWHGAAMHFVLWGGLNGLYQVFEDITKKKIPNRILSSVCTFVLVDFAWLFFRSSSIGDAFKMIGRTFTSFAGDMNLGLSTPNLVVAIVGIAVLMTSDIFKFKNVVIREKLQAMPMVLRDFIVAFSIMLILIFGIWGAGYDASAFIYFQF